MAHHVAVGVSLADRGLAGEVLGDVKRYPERRRWT
jgi:hypothetical protein